MGTLGRLIADGAEEVQIFGETIRVGAEISVLAGISGHADKAGLMRWLGGFRTVPDHVFIVHGEDSVCDEFARFVGEQFGFDADAPYSGSIYDLERGVYERKAEPIRVVKKRKSGKGVSDPFAVLEKLARRLLDLVAAYKGRANRDIRSFSHDLEELCEKYEKDL